MLKSKGRRMEGYLVVSFLLLGVKAMASCPDGSGCFENPTGCSYDCSAPTGCTSTCTLSATWTGLSEDEYALELFGKVDSEGYLALGLPDSSAMGPAPVFACSLNLANNETVNWNTASSSSPVTSSTEHLLTTLNITASNGFMKCNMVFKAKFDIVTSDGTNKSYDLNKNPYYVILAKGAVSGGLITYHEDRVKSPDKYTLGDSNQFLANDQYDNCGGTVGCSGLPADCVDSKNCTVILRWFGVSENLYNMTVFGPALNTPYSAMALSSDNSMGNDIVVACSPKGDVSFYWNLPSLTSVKLPSSILGLSNQTIVVNDQNLKCSFLLDSTLNISVPTSKDYVSFNINKNEYYILLATGPINSDGIIQYHNKRLASSSAIELFNFNSFVKANVSQLSYSGCFDTWGCSGQPAGCETSKNCSMLAKWKGISEEQYEINLSGLVETTNTYLAVGLSLDNMMGNDSVVTCLGTSGTIETYWNTVYNSVPVNTTTPSIFNSTLKIEDGIMNCSFIINSKFSTNITNLKISTEVDLNTVEYYILLATGPVNSSNLIEKHTEKSASFRSVDMSDYNTFISQNVYDECFQTKGCFGTPNGCIQSKNCKIVMTYAGVSDVSFQFEIGYPSTASTSYSAFALSDDDSMGDDSVMACIMNNGKIDVNMYWNTDKPLNSVILKDPYFGLSGISGTYKSGFVHCTFKREATTNIPVSENSTVKFDLKSDKYFLLLATGGVDSYGTIQKHSLTDHSSSAQDLGSYDPIENASKLLVKLHGIAMMLGWLLFANLGVFVALYFKGSFQVK